MNRQTVNPKNGLPEDAGTGEDRDLIFIPALLADSLTAPGVSEVLALLESLSSSELQVLIDKADELLNRLESEALMLRCLHRISTNCGEAECVRRDLLAYEAWRMLIEGIR